MELLTNSVVPNRWANTRVPPDGAEMSSTVILKVKVVNGSGKIRDGGVSDERKDKDNEEITSRVWTGVVPVWQTYGEPVPSPSNRVKEVPEHIKSYVTSTNEQNRAYATNAVKGESPLKEQG